MEDINDDYFILSDIPVTYGDDAFRERILERTKGERDPIGLVLTGGSARAFAHIGVLRYLEENGIVPDFIISNSMGSVIALFYAAGFSPDQISNMLESADLSSFFSITLPIYGGLLNSEGFKSFSQSIAGEDLRIEDLEIPVMVVCDDLVTHREIRIAEGNFADVLLASFALPVYFSPQRYNGHVLIDGGVKNLVPLSIAYDYTDTVIVSTTFYDVDSLNLLNMITILNRAFDIGKNQRAASDIKKHPDAIWIRCSVEQFSFMDFSKASELAEIGYESAKREKESLEKLYKSGTDEFKSLRDGYSSTLESASNNLYYFNHINALSPAHLVTVGFANFQQKNTYLNQSNTFGLEYIFKYKFFELEANAGFTFNTRSGNYDKFGPGANIIMGFYPLENLKISLDFSTLWYQWLWLPTIYAAERIEYKAYEERNLFGIEFSQSTEYLRVADEKSEILFSLDFSGKYENSVWKMRANAGYMFTYEVEEDRLSHYANINMKNRFALPLSFYLDIDLTERISLTDKKVTLFSLDGYVSPSIDVFYGLDFNAQSITIIKLSPLYRIPLSPTLAEFLIFEDIEIGTYFDALFADSLFYFSTGAELQTRISLIGLVDLPLRIRAGYESYSNAFVFSLIFSTKY